MYRREEEGRIAPVSERHRQRANSTCVVHCAQSRRGFPCRGMTTSMSSSRTIMRSRLLLRWIRADRRPDVRLELARRNIVASIFVDCTSSLALKIFISPQKSLDSVQGQTHSNRYVRGICRYSHRTCSAHTPTSNFPATPSA